MGYQTWLKGVLKASFALGLLTTMTVAEAEAQSRSDTLRVIWPYEVVSLDPLGTGAIRSTWGLAWHLYDRLFTYEVEKVGETAYHYDDQKLKGELAESWNYSADRKTLTIRIRENTIFHDGSQVTAEDVRWSLERAMSLKGGKFLTTVAGLKSADQISVVDPKTVKITFPAPNRLTLAILSVPSFVIMNADLAKANATADDPWATKWLQNNSAGSGAYEVESLRNEQVVLKRFDRWGAGQRPVFERVVFRTVPEPSTRGALVERGSADVAIVIPPDSLSAIQARGDADTIAIPMKNQIEFLGFNSQKSPFDDVRVRQAISHAIPYQEVFQTIYLGRGIPLFGADGPATKAQFPQPHALEHDMEKARHLLKQAGFEDGFATTLTYCTCKAEYFEPMAIVLKDSLSKVGVDVTIRKLPGAQYGELETAKTFDMVLSNFVSWVTAYPDYWFSIFYTGDWRPNYGNYKSAEMDRLIESVKGDVDDKTYATNNVKMVNLALTEVPILPIRNGAFELVLSKDVAKYVYWFHSLPDARMMERR